MERKRKVKIIIMIALMVTITGMSLGFAAFSASLNISSSATVNPNSSDFNVKIYGLDSGEQFEEVLGKLENGYYFDESLFSDNSSVPYIIETGVEYASGATAIIDNSLLSISNISASFVEPSYFGGVYYMFFIKNDGKYTAYLDYEKLMELGEANLSCVGLEETSPTLAAAACESLTLEILMASSDGQDLNDMDQFMIAPNDYIVMLFLWKYGVNKNNVVLPDGPIKYTVDNFNLPLTTRPIADQNIYEE